VYQEFYVPFAVNESGNVCPVNTALLTGYQIGILRGARSIQRSSGLIKQNINFEKSHELKGRSEKFKKTLAILKETVSRDFRPPFFS
jgi:hypothetical protein